MSTFNIQKTDTFINTARSNQKILLRLKDNTLSGNIIDEPIVIIPPPVPCDPGLIFVCSDNSQYLPLI